MANYDYLFYDAIELLFDKRPERFLMEKQYTLLTFSTWITRRYDPAVLRSSIYFCAAKIVLALH